MVGVKRTSASPISVKEWLAKLPADVRLITRALRLVARKNMPDAHEFIYHDAIGYSVNDSPFDRICYIAPQKKGYVNFGFFFGAGLPDPQKLLTGEGKRLRHIKVWSVDEAQNPALAKLIAATWKEAPESIAAVHAGRKRSKV
ncbi:MAG TPA: DUF1801 domain-containing protein [Anaerolineales bacterium]|nr:DUF1801 domain-containing protein [Anaerolineales bacterium]